MAGGQGVRRLSVGEPATWLALCGGIPAGCHEAIHADPAVWTKARQMAFKLVGDPGNFDLEIVNRILSGGRGRPVEFTDMTPFLEAR